MQINQDALLQILADFVENLELMAQEIQAIREAVPSAKSTESANLGSIRVLRRRIESIRQEIGK